LFDALHHLAVGKCRIPPAMTGYNTDNSGYNSVGRKRRETFSEADFSDADREFTAILAAMRIADEGEFAGKTLKSPMASEKQLDRLKKICSRVSSNFII